MSIAIFKFFGKPYPIKITERFQAQLKSCHVFYQTTSHAD